MKVQAFDGTWVEYELPPLPCGGTPQFDDGSGYSYRCDICGAVVGSIGMPKRCKELWDEKESQIKMWSRLKDTKVARFKNDDTWSDLS